MGIRSRGEWVTGLVFENSKHMFGIGFGTVQCQKLRIRVACVWTASDGAHGAFVTDPVHDCAGSVLIIFRRHLLPARRGLVRSQFAIGQVESFELPQDLTMENGHKSGTHGISHHWSVTVESPAGRSECLLYSSR